MHYSVAKQRNTGYSKLLVNIHEEVSTNETGMDINDFCAINTFWSKNQHRQLN
jgi:hypothetical protein